MLPQFLARFHKIPEQSAHDSVGAQEIILNFLPVLVSKETL